ncbi:MAG TPA: aldo/keto reductase [Usitatibacter sp.]|nr:aldo/keto reductase [Usitatibacter sp.]
MRLGEIDRREALRRMGIAAAGLALAASREGSANSPPPSAMHLREIPSTHETLPVIGIGTWQTFDVGTGAEREPLEEVLRMFAQMGGRLIDSSPMYGRSEEVAGDLVAKTGAPSKPFIATKVWTSGKEEGIRQMRDSMRKLRVKACDLMQVHNLLDVDTHLETLAAWKKEGLVRYVGVTHYTASGADAVAKVISRRPVDFVQINYSVAERDAEERLLPICKDKGVAVIANRPFAGGDLFRRLRATPLPPWAAEIDCSTWAQLMLKFIVSHPAMTCAIPASAKPEHTRDNMGAGYGRMPDEAMRKRIAEAVARA